MKTFIIALLLLPLLLSCSPTFKTGVADGKPGDDGYSFVLVHRAANTVECPNSAGGNATDIYTDTDKSGTYSDGDVFENTIFVCHGYLSVGIVTETNYPNIDASPCKDILNGHEARRRKIDSKEIWVYLSGYCPNSSPLSYSSPSTTGRVAIMSSHNEIYWQTAHTFFAIEEQNNGSTIKGRTVSLGWN